MKILNYGSMNIDNVYSVAHIVTPGETTLSTQKNLYCGGKGLNQSIALAKAGGDVYHASVIGEDGAMLQETLERFGGHSDYIKHAPGASSHTVIQVDEGGQNSIIVSLGEHMQIFEDEIDQILTHFETGDILILQNELHNSPLMMKKASDIGMCVIFNPSPMDDAIQSYPLDKVNWFILNENEGATLTGETDPQKILSGMQAKFPNASVVLTLGVDGAYCFHEGKTLFQPSFTVPAVDTTAAGDTFTGYFVTGLSKNEPLDTVMLRAARASSITVSRKGAADSIPVASEVEE